MENSSTTRNTQEMVFCGAHRTAELRRMQAAFQDVADAAIALREGEKRTANMRVVLIEGERGVGKTRLAMELYRHLTITHDPEHYWPDQYDRTGERFVVMPQADKCSYQGSPDFLWWGMGVDEIPKTGGTVFSSLSDLFPHLTTARITARRRKSGKGISAELADLGSEFGIPIAEAALELAGIGTIKNIGMAAWKIGEILRKHAGESNDPTEDGRKQVNSVVDSVMSDLTRLFSPAARDFAGIPLVVFVDDAQFADGDTAMSAFVERIIARGNRENWPILLVLTHWGRQLGKWTDRTGKLHQPSHIAKVLDHARNGSPTEPGPFTTEGGGSVPPGVFVHICLGQTEDDLSPAISARFPGLTTEDVGAISEKSGGNPRKLEQIMARMERKPRWFEGNDLTAGLTETGRAAVMALADLSIDEVVLERFVDTPPEVRRAMMMASFVGNRFVVDLVDRLAQAQLATAARDDLGQAETRYRFLRDVIDKSRNDIASFTERLFVEAAQEYRESGMARAEISDWPEDKAIFDALDQLLFGLVKDPDAFDTLNPDDIAECLALSATRMSDQELPLAGLALARLVHLENGRGNPEGAYEAARRFIEGFDG